MDQTKKLNNIKKKYKKWIKADIVINSKNKKTVKAAIRIAGDAKDHLRLPFTTLKIKILDDNFHGVRRRFDIRINTQEIVFVDDYAHHPTEVKSTIRATKEFFPKRNLTVVFQPHLFTRTRDFANDFAWSLSQADKLILLDIYPAREAPILGVDSKMLFNLCKNSNKELCSKNELLNRLNKSDIDVLLTLGAGDIGTLVNPIQKILD